MGGTRTKRQPKSKNHSADRSHGRQGADVAHPLSEALEFSYVELFNHDDRVTGSSF